MKVPEQEKIDPNNVYDSKSFKELIIEPFNKNDSKLYSKLFKYVFKLRFIVPLYLNDGYVPQGVLMAFSDFEEFNK